MRHFVLSAVFGLGCRVQALDEIQRVAIVLPSQSCVRQQGRSACISAPSSCLYYCHGLRQRIGCILSHASLKKPAIASLAQAGVVTAQSSEEGALGLQSSATLKVLSHAAVTVFQPHRRQPSSFRFDSSGLAKASTCRKKDNDSIISRP